MTEALSAFVNLDGVRERLSTIFGAVGKLELTNLTAARTVFTMLYVGAIDGANPIRPTTVCWMSDDFAKVTSHVTRQAFYAAANRTRRSRDQLAAELGFPAEPVWYADNSREGIRDDCLRHALLPNGAVLRDTTQPVTSAKGIWTLRAKFAALFDVMLTGDDLAAAVAAWQKQHLTAVGQARVQATIRHAANQNGVTVTLPDRTSIVLPTGEASEITRDVIELMASRLLTDPAVLFVASGTVPVPPSFAALNLDSAYLPDIVIVDLDLEDLWFVEVVATDGVVTADRRQALIAWAEANGLDGASCQFVTAFASRTRPPIRRRLAEIAWDTMVWFADEPDNIVYLSQIR